MAATEQILRGDRPHDSLPFTGSESSQSTKRHSLFTNKPMTSMQLNKVNVELSHDWRTNALVHVLGLSDEITLKSGSLDDGTLIHEVSAFHTWVPTLATIIVSSIQLLMAWATFNYVRNNMILSLRNPLLTAYEMFVGSNQTLTTGLVEAICGQYDDQSMAAGMNGPLNHISMPDGSVYRPNDEQAMFYHMKSPFRTFNYGKLGIDDRSVLDNTLYVIHEGLTVNPLGNGAGYSCLFILMMAIWLFAVCIEYRTIFHNATVLIHFKNDPSAEHNFEVNEEENKFKLAKMTAKAKAVLIINIFTRFLVTTALLITGSFLILYTTNKMDLILNALAILFIIEIDQILYFATVSGAHQSYIENIEPLEIYLPENSLSWKVWEKSSQFMPLLPFVMNFGAAAFLRLWQLNIFKVYFNMAAAMCLFAGPIPGDMHDLSTMAPAAGFCDSLLGIRCAPDVSPASTLEAHGPCVITDQGVGNVGTAFFYLDDPNLFEGRLSKEGGSLKSWSSWGEGNSVLYEKGIWNFGPYQDIMRKNCLQMYQTTGVLQDRLVDEDEGTHMRGAPFWCTRQRLWGAVFGKFTEGKEAATDINMKSIEQVRALDDPLVVEAVDACRHSTGAELSVAGDKSAESAAGSTKQQTRKRRKQHKLNIADGVISAVPPQGAESVSTKQQRQPKTLPTKQQTEGTRQKKLGPAGMLEITRPPPKAQLARANISAEGDIS